MPSVWVVVREYSSLDGMQVTEAAAESEGVSSCSLSLRG
jgi:hypothetical protein